MNKYFHLVGKLKLSGLPMYVRVGANGAITFGTDETDCTLFESRKKACQVKKTLDANAAFAVIEIHTEGRTNAQADPHHSGQNDAGSRSNRA